MRRQTSGMSKAASSAKSHSQSERPAVVAMWAAASAIFAVAASLWLAFGPCYFDRPCSSMLQHLGLWILIPLSVPFVISMLAVRLVMSGSGRGIWVFVLILVLLAVASTPLGAVGAWYLPSIAALLVAAVLTRRL